MRCYHFCLYQLMPIQHGIQSAHAQMELFVKYDKPSHQKRQLYQWAEDHKTMICLNGGPYGNLVDIFNIIDHIDNPYPYSAFYEDEHSLAGLMTNIAIVLPQKIYDNALLIRLRKRSIMDITLPLSVFDRKLISLLNRCNLV